MQVYAFIDGSPIATAVCDAAAWTSLRVQVPLKLVHVLERAETNLSGDLSGSLGMDSREHLLDELVALDERRSKLALEHGQHMLAAAQDRVREDGVKQVSVMQRHGSLVDTVAEMDKDIRVMVLGRLGEGHECSAHTIGSHLENVIRTSHRPILVAMPEFSAPGNFMIAYDGSSTAEKALDMVVASPLLKGLPCHLVTVCPAGDERLSQVEYAAQKLRSAGFEVINERLEGDVHEALAAYQKDRGIELLVMGAYGHSRIRQFFVGSNTSRIVSLSDIPVLLLR